MGRSATLGRSLLAAVLGALLGCGTILYPERRGQQAGQLDAGIVVLDALGLLVFFVPGVVAFAVDFATGAIYLPRGRKQSELLNIPPAPRKKRRSAALEIERHPLEERSLAGVEAALRAYAGIDVDLRAEAVRIEVAGPGMRLDALLASLDAPSASP
jgi:hypothetical protein